MVALLITSFLLLAGIVYAVYLWQRPSSNRGAELQLPPPAAAGLFADTALDETPARALTDGETEQAERRRTLLARAQSGDKEALRDAQDSTDPALYDEVLNALVEHTDDEKKLLALCSYIARSDDHLRVNANLAERFIKSWKAQPDRNKTAKMLHIAALADDSRLYQRAVETAYDFWRDGRLQGINADELRQLIESEFWLLAPAERNSGAGFVLKRTLARLRRKLAAERQ